MSRNKNEGSSHRLKTLESLYTCGRDHGIPQRPEAQSSKLREMMNRKLDIRPSNARIATLPSKTKLQPIKEAKLKASYQQAERTSPSEEEKHSRLREFLQRNQQLLEVWRKEEAKEKEKFKSRLKLAALTSHKSLEKPARKSKQNLKHSFKNLPQSPFPSPQRLSKHWKLPNERLGSAEAQAYKYYLQNLLTLMEENKQQLLESRKKIKKQMRREEREQLKEEKQLLKEEKQHIIASKQQLVREIEQQLMREQQHDQHIKMERYRRELEAELEQELFQQEVIASPQKQPSPLLQPNKKKQEPQQECNPEQSTGRGMDAVKEKLKSRSLGDLGLLSVQGASGVAALSELEKERCLKVIKRSSKKDQQ